MSKRTFEVGAGLTCDVDRLVASRLLIQANSGGGKTRTLRRLLEQTHGKVQHLVIDPEGEYHTLRERFDYVLAAPKGGDTVAHPRTAKLLAERLLQLGVSAILDIYELNPDERQRFVKGFLQALVDAPRDLWHPALVILDEAHVYAPEGKESESTAAVKAMASRGRKRGFCLVPATQRLAKLSKDVAAECNNKLIGRCTLDVDIKRAAEELGFTTNEQRQALRQLEPGQFYAFGPAFGIAAPQIVRVGGIKTTHPEPGQQAAPVPPPTEKVRKVLQQLADLPAEADAREKSIAELKKENADLKRQVAQATKATKPDASPVLSTKVVEKQVIGPKEVGRLESVVKRLEQLGQKVAEGAEMARNAGVVAQELLTDIRKTAVDVRQLLAPAPAHTSPASAHRTAPSTHKVADRVHIMHAERQPPARRASRSPSVDGAADDVSLGAMHRAILTALAQHPDGLTKRQVRAYTDYAEGGALSRAYALVHRLGLVVTENGKLLITDLGLTTLGPFEPLPKGAALREHVLDGTKINSMEKALLRLLFDAYPNDVAKNDLREQTGYAEGGALSRAYAHLVSIDYAVKVGKGRLKAAEPFFDE